MGSRIRDPRAGKDFTDMPMTSTPLGNPPWRLLTLCGLLVLVVSAAVWRVASWYRSRPPDSDLARYYRKVAADHESLEQTFRQRARVSRARARDESNPDARAHWNQSAARDEALVADYDQLAAIYREAARDPRGRIVRDPPPPIVPLPLPPQTAPRRTARGRMEVYPKLSAP
jgi:hypothetical protein